jgi:hypothetical protein
LHCESRAAEKVVPGVRGKRDVLPVWEYKGATLIGGNNLADIGKRGASGAFDRGDELRGAVRRDGEK